MLFAFVCVLLLCVFEVFLVFVFVVLFFLVLSVCGVIFPHCLLWFGLFVFVVFVGFCVLCVLMFAFCV